MKDESNIAPMPTNSDELRRWMVAAAGNPSALEVYGEQMAQWLKGELPQESSSDFDSMFRCDCAAALGKTAYKTQTAVRILIEALPGEMGYDANGGDIYGGVWMVYVWEAIRDALCAAKENALPLLIAAIDDPDPLRRERVVRVLGHLGSLTQDAIPALIRRLTDPGAAVRWAAREALKEICGGDNLILCALLQSPDPEIVYGALYAIEPLPAELVAWCAGLLEHPETRFRSLAAIKLATARRAADSASPALVRSLNDPDIDVRRWVIEALGWVGLNDPDAPAALVRAAPSTLPINGHPSALSVLRARKPAFIQKAFPDLLNLLEDPEFKDRRLVLETVQTLDVPVGILPSLIHLAESVLAEPVTPRGLREPILDWALGAIVAQEGAGDAQPLLERAKMDASESVRAAADVKNNL